MVGTRNRKLRPTLITANVKGRLQRTEFSSNHPRLLKKKQIEKEKCCLCHKFENEFRPFDHIFFDKIKNGKFTQQMDKNCVALTYVPV